MFVLLRVLSIAFYQILYMSIIASIIGLVILLIQKIIDRRISPKCNYFIWLSFILILIFPVSIPSKLSIYNFFDINEIKLIENKNIEKRKNSFIENTEINTINENKHINNDIINCFLINFRIIISNILLLISLLKILKTIITYKLLMYEVGNDEVYDERVLRILKDCKSELKIKGNVRLINQNFIKSPAIFGVINAKILFPETMSSEDDVVLRNIFMHELAHYKRKDNLINFIIMILNSLYWFNPIIKYMFGYIRKDIEFATDELAIKNMSGNEAKVYCDTIIEMAGRCSSKIGPVLAFSASYEYIEKRIDLISLREKFKKFSQIISIFTFIIIIVICLVFYPTSFGMMNVPKLYLRTSNGNLTEVMNVEENQNIKTNVINLKSGSKLELIVKDAEPNEVIYFNKINTKDDFDYEKITSICNREITQFENGEYLYKFTIENELGKTFNYVVKVIVE